MVSAAETTDASDERGSCGRRGGVVGSQPTWPAELHLRFATRGGRTHIAASRHSGPLLVQRPFHPEGGVCHTYLVHPPGGVVGGDRLRVEIEASPGSHALVTTPAATKFYRCDGRVGRVDQQMRLPGATVEWLPQENIFYRGTDARAATRVYLTPESKFIGWEVACLGLPARNELFERGTLGLDMELWMSDLPLVVERFRLSGPGAARGARWGLAGYAAIGTLMAFPADRNCVQAVRSAIDGLGESAVTVVDGVLVCRCLGTHAEEVRRVFVRAWQSVRSLLLGRSAVAPRIWAT